MTMQADGSMKTKLAAVGANQPILEAFGYLKEHHGASQRKNADVALHMIVGYIARRTQRPEGPRPTRLPARRGQLDAVASHQLG